MVNTKNCLDAVEHVVREQGAVVAGVRLHHLISLREHIDRARGIGHDLVEQPVLERADPPLVYIVDHKQGIAIGICLLDHHVLHEVGLLDHEAARSPPRRRRSSRFHPLPPSPEDAGEAMC